MGLNQVSTRIVIVLFMAVITGSSAAIIAYDCRTEEINKTAISLVQLPDCTTNRMKPVHVSTQLVVSQTEKKRRIPISRCLVTASHLVYRCGSWLGADTPVDSYTQVIRVGRDDCERLIRDGSLILPGTMNQLVQFQGTGKFSHSYWSWGGFSGKSCDPGPTLSVNGRAWERAVRLTNLEVTYTTATAHLEVDTGKLILANGERCEYNTEHCDTADYGNIFWQRYIPTCTSDAPTVTVFKGLGELITTTDKTNRSLQFIHVSHGGYDFQIKLENSNKASVCGYPSRHTEHPDLFVTIMDSSSPPFPPVPELDADNVNLMSYINSKLVYAMRHTKEQVDSLFDLFHQQRCSMQNRITQNLQTLALLSPREFAYQYFGRPGFTAVARGEAIYAAQCKAVAVTPKPLDRGVCFNELVVTYNNQTWYMTPRTRIIISEGTIIPCSAEFSPIYLLGNKWISQNSLGLTEVPKPTVITTEDIEYEFETMANLASGGLYTPEVLREYQRILTSPMEEAVVVARMTDSLRGSSQLPSGYSFARGLTEDDFSFIGGKVGWMGTVWSWWSRVSVACAAVMLFIYVMNTVISVVNCCLHFKYIRREQGLKSAILAGLFSSIGNLILSGRWPQKQSPSGPEEVTLQPRSFVWGPPANRGISDGDA